MGSHLSLQSTLKKQQSLRKEPLEKRLRSLAPGHTFKLETKDKIRILDINAEGFTGHSTWVDVPLTEADWTLSVIVPDKINANNMNVFLMLVFFTFFFTHMIYIIVEELIVRRNTKNQKILNESQKIEFVGTLAASTAKNPLTGIKGLVQLLVEKHPEEQDQFYYSVIMKEIERINSFVSEFLILGKPMAQTLSIYDITVSLLN